MAALAVRQQSAARQSGRTPAPAPVRTESAPPGDEHPAHTTAHVSLREIMFHALAARPEQRAVLEDVDAIAYPAFMRHTDLAPLWQAIYATFPEYQLILADTRTGQHLAHGNLVPFSWDGTTANLPHSAVEMVERSLADYRRGAQPTVLGALQAVVNPTQQGAGLSTRMLQGMAGLASALRIPDLVAPIRPTEKARDPLSSLQEYVSRARPDGLPIDPWQRVHARLGATPVGIEDAWLSVTATLDDWHSWTGVAAPPDGPYLVPGALAPVELDATGTVGRYVEPHLWMRYRIG